MSAPVSKSAGEPSYEAARAELAEVMKALESGGQSLEDSLELWRRGEELAEICQRWLDEAGRRLDEAIAARSDSGDAPDSPGHSPAVS
jgi:exodeoxyribonuclease VII small subunit